MTVTVTYYCQGCERQIALDTNGPGHVCPAAPAFAPGASGAGALPPPSFPITISPSPDAWVDQLSDAALDRLAARIEQRRRRRQRVAGG
jgi:hypothetical protein